MPSAARKQVEGQMSFFGTTNVYVPPKRTTTTSNKSQQSLFDFEKIVGNRKEGTPITYEQLQKLFQLGLRQVQDIGIEVPVSKISPTCEINTRAKRRWGHCSKRRGTYYITIAERLLSAEVIFIMDTIVHEILHTCDGCMNHGPKWQKYANMVNSKYGYHVKTTTSSEEKLIEINLDEFKYLCKCDKCGYLAGRHKMSDLIRYPQSYKHNNCGGRFERVR